MLMYKTNEITFHKVMHAVRRQPEEVKIIWHVTVWKSILVEHMI